jgi:hypothetical protein
MANTSSYLVEEQLIVRVWVHKKPCIGQTVAQAVTLLDWEKHALSFGSVAA